MSIGVLVRGGAGDCDECEDCDELRSLQLETTDRAPALYWPLDDVGATAVDMSGNGLPGTYSGGPMQSQPALLPGASSCTDFDGTDDYVQLAAGLDLGAGGWTIQAVVEWDVNNRPWVYTQQTSNLIAAALSGTSSTSTGGTHVGMGWWSPSTWRRLGISVGATVPNGPSIWHAIFEPVDGRMTLMRDGAIVALTYSGLGPGAGAPAAGFRVGRHGDETSPRFDGRMSDVAIWARPLSIGECERLALAALTPP